MLSANIVAENRGCHVLLQRAPKGTPSSILVLRLRRCFHHHGLSRSPISSPSALHTSPSVYRSAGCLPNVNGAPTVRYATTHSSPPPPTLSDDAVVHVQSLLARWGANRLPSAEPLLHSHTPNTPVSDGPGPPPAPAPSSTSIQSADPTDPFQGALLAMRLGDTRRVLKHLRVIEKMSREDLVAAVAALPRTTFTEFFRALDPLRVSRDCDPIGKSHTTVGMYQVLNMTSSIDEYGVRKLYTKLLRCLLILMTTLQAAGYILHQEEYISLIRCAGASADLTCAGALWNDLNTTPHVARRTSELYTEYIKTRFLTEPLYTNYQKVARMVMPRNLHRSRLLLHIKMVSRLDAMFAYVRSRRLRFDQNKAIEDVEVLMRALRGNGPAVRLFNTVIAYHSFRVDESLLCALMIALGRSGSLHLIGEQILQRFFGIRTPHPPEEHESRAQSLSFTSEPPRVRPSVRLMRAVVETYGSNAEIGVAVQLVEHLSNAYNITIPRDVWQDLLEWTYVMSGPPASTAWKIAKLPNKIPSPQAVEMIWNAMISPPYNLIPTFQNYDILIRSLIGRRDDDLTPVLSRMREAILLYDEQCREYEAAVFEYTLYLRASILPSAIVTRFERARYKKQRMWFTIMKWCRSLFKRIPTSGANPDILHPLVPRLIEEFRPFLQNPVEYITPTGRVSLFDPATETFKVVITGYTEQWQVIRTTHANWKRHRFLNLKRETLSTHSLAKFKTSQLTNPLSLLAPRRRVFVPPIIEHQQKDGFDGQQAMETSQEAIPIESGDLAEPITS